MQKAYTGGIRAAMNSREANLKTSKRIMLSIAVSGLILAMVPGLHAQQAAPSPSPSSAQKDKSPDPAPIPVQITAAQKVFIANAGGESFETVFSQTVFDGGPDRPYNQFYAAMKTWGRYEPVSSPANADMVIEVSWALSDTGLKLPVLGQLRVVVIDPKTHVTLWNFTEYVRGAVFLGNRNKNFDHTMNTIVDRLKKLTEPVAAAGP
jgi:hypothetical protein